MTFSIIIPFYNSQTTLGRCLDSISQQSYRSFEVLMIDDGSSDNSAEIAEAFAKKDYRFVLIQQSNGGPSSARNCGLDLARGEIIAFVDSDDYVVSDYLQQLYVAFCADNAQVVFFGVNQIDPITNKVFTRNISKLPSNAVEQIITLTKADLFGYTWIKAISRELIGSCRFDEALNLFEDEVFTCQIMQKQPVISLIEKPLYNQIVQTGSLSRRTHVDYYIKCESAYLAWKNLLNSMQVAYCPVLHQKADHMTNMCKYYYLEKKVPPIRFARELGKCTFFRDSSVDDILIKAIKNGKIGFALIIRILYRGKIKLKIMNGR